MQEVLSDYRVKKILHGFCLELTATQTAQQLHLNRHTINRYYRMFREKIAAYEGQNLTKLSGSVEIDESYFGSSHRGDKRGRAPGRKIPVVGILKRKGVVHTAIIPDASRKTLLPITEKPVRNSKSTIGVRTSTKS